MGAKWRCCSQNSHKTPNDSTKEVYGQEENNYQQVICEISPNTIWCVLHVYCHWLCVRKKANNTYCKFAVSECSGILEGERTLLLPMPSIFHTVKLHPRGSNSCIDIALSCPAVFAVFGNTIAQRVKVVTLAFNPVTWPVHLHTGTGHYFRTAAYPERPHSFPWRHVLRLHGNAAAQPDTPLCQWSQEPPPPHVGPWGSRRNAPEQRAGLGPLPGAASDPGHSRSHDGTEHWSTAGLETKMLKKRFMQQSNRPNKLLSLQGCFTEKQAACMPSSFQCTQSSTP